VQTRLILLDAPLLLFMTCAIYCYIRFFKQRYKCVCIDLYVTSTSYGPHSPFSNAWWSWMVATGVFLALTISCKMVGLFLFMMIGAAVANDLWNILDYRRGHDMVRRIPASTKAR
jgi:dolichyl-phosphate-mannose-protein mannosyltransferase